MSAHLVGTYPVGSQQWLAARYFKMTGSRIAAAAGISPYESPFSLYYRMLGEIGEVEETPIMEWGTRLEDAIRDKFRDEHPDWSVEKTGVWQHDDRPWQSGSPDGLVAEKTWTEISDCHGDLAARIDQRGTVSSILEIKTARYPDEWGTPGTDEIPVHYRAQVLWYLDCLGLDLAHIAVLIGGSDYREYRIEYDQVEAVELRRIGREFLDRLEVGRRPDIDGDASTRQAIRELHPDISGTVDVPNELAHRVFDAAYDFNYHSGRFDLARAMLADHMGNAHQAFWNGIKIADRRVKGIAGVPYIQLANNIGKHREAS